MSFQSGIQIAAAREQEPQALRGVAGKRSEFCRELSMTLPLNSDRGRGFLRIVSFHLGVQVAVSAPA